jgi:hypothetical protein
MWGGGYAVNRLAPLTWLADRDLLYWGDIDTHGFAIVNRLRAAFPAARSVLMDRATLMRHRSQWIRETTITGAGLPLLTADEQQVVPRSRAAGARPRRPTGAGTDRLRLDRDGTAPRGRERSGGPRHVGCSPVPGAGEPRRFVTVRVAVHHSWSYRPA